MSMETRRTGISFFVHRHSGTRDRSDHRMIMGIISNFETYYDGGVKRYFEKGEGGHGMDEKILELVEQYNIEVTGGYRGRGGYHLTTSEGFWILKEFHSSAGKLIDEQEYKENLIRQGFPLVDEYVKNKDGSYFIQDRYRVVYVLKKYFQGEECNIRKKEEVYQAGENLGRLHRASNACPVSRRLKERYRPLNLQFAKKTRELRRVYRYVSAIGQKNPYERLFAHCFPGFLKQADRAMLQIEALPEKALEPGIVHGDYNQHNILYTREGLATVNFDHFSYESQLLDLHHFLRKVLEKNHFSMEYAYEVIGGYSSIIGLRPLDYQLLYCLLAYPDKFWKVSNHYFNGKKGWIAPKRMEKLNDLIDQNQTKEKFLVDFQKEFL